MTIPAGMVLPPLTGDPAKDFAQSKGLLPLTGDPAKDFAHLPSSTVQDGNPLHAEFAAGNLAKRVATENQQDADVAKVPGAPEQVLGAATALSNGLPGVQALQSYLSAKANGIPYSQAYGQIQDAQNTLPAGAKFAASAAGALPLYAMASGPLSIAKSAALIGGLGGAANADPALSPARRGLNAGVDAVEGLAAGKAGEMIPTAFNAMIAQDPEQAILNMQAQRALSAGRLYAAAQNEGQGVVAADQANAKTFAQKIADLANAGKQPALPAPGQSDVARASMENANATRFLSKEPVALTPETLEQAAARDYTTVTPSGTPAGDTPLVRDYTNPRPVQLQAANDVNVRQGPTMPSAAPSSAGPVDPLAAVRAFVNEPDIADIVSRLQGQRQFANVDATDPVMLDAIYKDLSDQSAAIKRGLAGANPKNMGRFAQQDIQGAKQQALNAYDTVMPSYRDAVNDFADQSQQIDAYRKAYGAFRTALSPNIPSANNLGRTGLAAASDALPNIPSAGAIPAANAAVNGLAGYLLRQAPLTAGRKAIAQVPSVLNQLGANATDPLENILRAVTASGAGAIASPPSP